MVCDYAERGPILRAIEGRYAGYVRIIPMSA